MEEPLHPAPSLKEEPAQGDIPWEEVVQWVETDLRRQISWNNGPSSPIPVSSILYSALRRVAKREAKAPQSLREIKPFLYTVAKRVRLEKFRNFNARKRQPENAAILAVGEHGALLQGKSNEDHQLWEAVSHLPQDQKEVLEGIYIMNFTQQEYAQRIGSNRKSIERLHRRALEALSRLLGGAGGE